MYFYLVYYILLGVLGFNEFGSFAPFTPKSLMPYNNQTFCLDPLCSDFYCASFYPKGWNLRAEHISRGFKSEPSRPSTEVARSHKTGWKADAVRVYSMHCIFVSLALFAVRDFPVKSQRFFLSSWRGECVSCLFFVKRLLNPQLEVFELGRPGRRRGRGCVGGWILG
jgi:hypothetical protein